MTFLRYAVAQLVDPERQHPGLFQFTVEFAELLCKLLALVGDIGALGRRILGGRGTELLQTLLRIAGARFEFVDLGPQRVRRRVECLSETGQRFGSNLVAADGRFDLVQRGLDRLERGRFGGLGPRGLIERRARSQKRARYGPKNELPPNRNPSASDRHECVSSRWGMPLLRSSRFGLRIRPPSSATNPARCRPPLSLDPLKTLIEAPTLARHL